MSPDPPETLAHDPIMELEWGVCLAPEDAESHEKHRGQSGPGRRSARDPRMARVARLRPAAGGVARRRSSCSASSMRTPGRTASSFRSPPTPPTSTRSPPTSSLRCPATRSIERRIKSLVRWNALAMVVRANKAEDGIGGHISTYRVGGDAVRSRLQPFLPRPGRRPRRRRHLLPGPRGARHLRARVSSKAASTRRSSRTSAAS